VGQDDGRKLGSTNLLRKKKKKSNKKKRERSVM
jgi:hypothetical protein